MRFVVLGDLHWDGRCGAAVREAVADLRALAPDFVLSVGDLTGGSGVGGGKALREAKALLDGLGVPVHAVAGNHDYEGAEFSTDRENLDDFLSVFGRETPWYARDFGAWKGVFLCNERFRDHTVQRHEVYLSPAQLAWFEETLARASAPVFVVCHASPLGSGLRILPELHLRGGNAYVNQNYEPGRIAHILLSHPGVRLWFSGHTHLGHQYPDAISRALGAHFVHCGTLHPGQNRDGKRHSRVVDLGGEGCTVATFDHDLRGLDGSLERKIDVRPFGD